MSFHSVLIQTFQNFKDVFLGSSDISNIGDGKVTGALAALDQEKQDKLTAGDNITIQTRYLYSEVTSECEVVANDSSLPAEGTEGIFYICENTGYVFVWIPEGEDYKQIDGYETSFVEALPAQGTENTFYILSTDNTVWICTVTDNVISTPGYTSEINSLSIATSELQSETTYLASEVADKQDTLIAGTGITISSNVISAIIGIDIKVVEELPSIDISTQSIYFVPAEAGSEDAYDEYVYVIVPTFTNVSETVVARSSSSQFPATGDVEHVYIDTTSGIVYAWDTENSQYRETQIAYEVVNRLPKEGSPQTIYAVNENGTINYYTYDNVGSWERIGSTAIDFSAYYEKSEVDDMFTSQEIVDSTQNSTISSLSTSASEIQSNVASMSTVQSMHTSEINSLSTASSELGSEYTVIHSEVATKQPMLVAGTNISIDPATNTISATSGASDLGDLTDVTLTTPTEGQVLSYNSQTDEWVNSTVATIDYSQEISSLTSENSLQTSEINSLSTAASELSSETTVLGSEVATKQDQLTAGAGITITNNVISSSAAGVKLEIVSTLPVSDIDPQTIYLVPSEDPQTDNEYDEYIYVQVGQYAYAQYDVVVRASSSEFPASGKGGYYYVDATTSIVYEWDSTNSEYVQDGYSYLEVNELPSVGDETVLYYLNDGSISAYYFYSVESSWEIIGSTAIDLTNYYTKTQVDSMFTSQSAVDSTQNSQISSLSTSASEIASNVASMSTIQSTLDSTQNSHLTSLSTENSTQTSEISSLSTATSELGSEVTIIGSEVDEKQPMLTAGAGIEIDANNIIKSTGAVIYANVLLPNGD